MIFYRNNIVTVIVLHPSVGIMLEKLLCMSDQEVAEASR